MMPPGHPQGPRWRAEVARVKHPSSRRGFRPGSGQPRSTSRHPLVRTVAPWGLSPGDLVWYFFSPSGIWPNSRAAYHEQSCLLAIYGVVRGKGLALTIQSVGWGRGAALGQRLDFSLSLGIRAFTCGIQWACGSMWGRRDGESVLLFWVTISASRCLGRCPLIQFSVMLCGGTISPILQTGPLRLWESI